MVLILLYDSKNRNAALPITVIFKPLSNKKVLPIPNRETLTKKERDSANSRIKI